MADKILIIIGGANRWYQLRSGLGGKGKYHSLAVCALAVETSVG